jgi:hypothetical protein
MRPVARIRIEKVNQGYRIGHQSPIVGAHRSWIPRDNPVPIKRDNPFVIEPMELRGPSLRLVEPSTQAWDLSSAVQEVVRKLRSNPADREGTGFVALELTGFSKEDAAAFTKNIELQAAKDLIVSTRAEARPETAPSWIDFMKPWRRVTAETMGDFKSAQVRAVQERVVERIDGRWHVYELEVSVPLRESPQRPVAVRILVWIKDTMLAPALAALKQRLGVVLPGRANEWLATPDREAVRGAVIHSLLSLEPDASFAAAAASVKRDLKELYGADYFHSVEMQMKFYDVTLVHAPRHVADGSESDHPAA